MADADDTPRDLNPADAGFTVDDDKPREGPRLRPAVAALVLDAERRVLIGRRNDSTSPHWQFPQGGMKVGESPEDAVFREMLEELGTSHVRILGVLPRRTRYVWRGDGDGSSGFDGQMHTWFVLVMHGEVEDEGESEEFAEFAWIDPIDILERTHPVRRATYSAVSRMFLEWLALHPAAESAGEEPKSEDDRTDEGNES